MYEIGSIIIENYNTSPKDNWLMYSLKYVIPPVVTLIIGLFTIFIGLSTLKRTLLDNLDSKSGWRKTLFEIAGKDKISLEDVFKLRTCLRFDKKDDKKDELSIFDNKTNEIIDFCNDMQIKYENKYSCESKILFNIDREKVRIYSRYLLANHWETLQLSKREYKKYKKHKAKKMNKNCYNKEKEIKNNKSYVKWYIKEKELEEKTNDLIKNLSK